MKEQTVKLACANFAKNIDTLLDGELQDAVSAELNAHAAECEDCAQLLGNASLALELCAELDADVEAPSDFKSGWRQAVQAEYEKNGAKQGEAHRRVMRRARPLMAFAAALVLIFGVTAAMQSLGIFSEEGATPGGGARNYAMPKGDGGQTQGYSDQLAQFNSEKEAGGDSNQSFEDSYDAQQYSDVNLAIASNASGRSAPSQTNAQKMIYTASVFLETTNFEQDAAALDAQLAQVEGFKQNTVLRGSPITDTDRQTGRISEMTVRVPADRLSAFLDAVKQIGALDTVTENAIDISLNYADTTIQLEAKRSAHTRIQALIEQAATLEDIAMLEDRLATLQAEIDSMESSLRGWDDQVNYATVTLRLTEVARTDVVSTGSPSLGGRMRDGFIRSVNAALSFLSNTAVALAMVLPQVLIWGALLVALYFIGRAVIRKIRR